MIWFLQESPAPLRIVLAAMLGVLLGAAVNWARYSLAFEPRFWSPWSRRHPRDAQSAWPDRLPIFGWLRLRRKAELLGPKFWRQPLLLELLCGVAVGAWYWWEVVEGRLLPPDAVAQRDQLTVMLHLQFVCHFVLAGFMLAAATIDIDERLIPDEVTVAGTLVGLALLTISPWMMLSSDYFDIGEQGVFLWLDLAAPNLLPKVLKGAPSGASLALGIGCYLLWCFALLPRVWHGRHGPRRAVQLMVARMAREPVSGFIGIMAIVGAALIGIVWAFEPYRWIGLSTSLVGMTVGMSIVWATRLIGRWAFRREAMGFGDVTLMAMIGAYVGWQPSTMIFFAAPIPAIVIHGVHWLMHRDTELPYGPYLCLSTVLVLTFWAEIWDVAGPRFGVVGLVPMVLVAGFFMLFVVLSAWRKLRGEPLEEPDEAAV